MNQLSFALTAVTLDEVIVRQRAINAKGRVIRIHDDDSHQTWLADLYDEIRAGHVLACVRSAQSLWLLLSCRVDELNSTAMRHQAQDAAGDHIEPLARLFFQYDLTLLAPYGFVRYAGALHLPVDNGWKSAAPFLRSLAVDLRSIQQGIWMIRMQSVCYMSGKYRPDKAARCFVVQTNSKGESFLLPTKKSNVDTQLAYFSTKALDRKVPWKAKPNVPVLDRFGMLSRILSHCQQKLGLRTIPVSVEPVQSYRQVGSVTQAKTELMHQYVMAEVGVAMASTRVHVYSHFGRPAYLAGIMREMFPFIEWVETEDPESDRQEITHLLAVVNNPDDTITGADDAKVILRQAGFPVMQCITEQTIAAIQRSIEKRVQKVAADLAQGRVEPRRQPQEHEIIGRALVVQLLLKTEIHQSEFLLPRPWMQADMPLTQYAFVYHGYGDPKWVLILPLASGKFDVQTFDRQSQIRLNRRIPVIVDPPDRGKDQRGRDFAKIIGAARRAVVIRNTEINAYCTHRKGHSGVWVIPELFGYLSQGSDAASSDLSTKTAPRLRIVETYEHGTLTSNSWRWEATLDMACLAYDPTVRMFRTAAFPVFVKLAAEIMDSLRAPKAAEI